MKEETYMVADSLGVFHPETYQVPDWTISRFFIEGGMTGMIILSLFLVALLLAAWKAPRWVKEIGLFALAFGFLGHLLGVFQVLSVLRDIAAEKGAEAVNISDLLPWRVLFGGLKVTMNCFIYGVIIYLVSLVVRVVKKPRL